jgi:hypothetical protein
MIDGMAIARLGERSECWFDCCIVPAARPVTDEHLVAKS